MRRSGVVEAIAGSTDAVGLSAKLVNSIGRSSERHKTYAPVEIEAVRKADDFPLEGRCAPRTERDKKSKLCTRQSLNFAAEPA